MSTLSRHTKHLMSDPRASLLLTGEPERGDPLNHPRVTLSGRIEKTQGPSARRRYLQRNPKARLYADFGDFAFFRFAIELSFQRRLRPRQPTRAGRHSELQRRPGGIDGGGAAPDRRDQRPRRRRRQPVAGRESSGRRVWRAIGLDSDGLDLSAGARVARLQFATPAHDEAGWRARIEEAMGGRVDRISGEAATAAQLNERHLFT